ncbi:hypothetical protein FH586_22055 (plasmid) [Leptospira weilii]|nr:hypothetical protein [Leptospira weilii]ULH30901.1 hypothetical protein FH586_22515 [Leptospira weilii]ULH30926.1 hypothetical protein FH586_21965 [Leptospira weilii]ULH30940.1 hypothetical protein FH586_22055 [Leptospira weilii]
MGANVAPGVSSIQNPGVGMTGGGSVGGMSVTGMYFYHPDHLGSITMITDGAGNPVSYRDPSGHVSVAGLMHMVNRIVGHAIGKDFHNGNRPSTKSIGKDFHRSYIGKKVNAKDITKGLENAYKGILKWTQRTTRNNQNGQALKSREKRRSLRSHIMEIIYFSNPYLKSGGNGTTNDNNKPKNDNPTCQMVQGVIQCGECIVYPSPACPLPAPDEPATPTIPPPSENESSSGLILDEDNKSVEPPN